jgi:uncharacterized phiE125 gp8 family phage protein
LEEAKEHLKIDDSFSDDRIMSLINTVTAIGELITGRDFITRTYECYLDCFPSKTCGIKIRRSKLQSITSIQYYLDGVLTTIDSADYYITNSPNFSSINLFEGNSWPSVDNRKQAIVITFVSGYGTSECSIPAPLKQAMLSHLALLFYNAGDCSSSDDSQAKSLYKPYIIPQKLVLVI